MTKYIYNDDQVNSIVEIIEHLTDQNQHTESLRMLATFLHEHDLNKAIAAVSNLQDYYGYLRNDISEIRKELSKTLFYILDHSDSLSQDNKEKIKKAF